MKVYISVDIEGVTGTTYWDDTLFGEQSYIQFAKQMTKETMAACEAAIEMGATEILVKDAHDSGNNVDMTSLPKEVKLIRGWMNSPDSMVEGIDKKFDAAIFIGYHAGAGYGGNPLAHTISSKKIGYLKINGIKASEYLINAYTTAYYGVPVVFVSGDSSICSEAKKMNREIETVAVKEGIGNATISINPNYACELIEDGVKKGLAKKENCIINLPDKFEVEIYFTDHSNAKRASYYPGVIQKDDHIIVFTATDVRELLTTKMFILTT